MSIRVQCLPKHNLLLLASFGTRFTAVLYRLPVQNGSISIPQVVDALDRRGTLFKAILLGIVRLTYYLVASLGLLAFVEFALKDLWLLHALKVLHGEDALRINCLTLTTQGINLDILLCYIAILVIELIRLHLFYRVVELFGGFLLSTVLHAAFIMVDTLDVEGLSIDAHG